jgi:hypothetical protein
VPDAVLRIGHPIDLPHQLRRALATRASGRHVPQEENGGHNPKEKRAKRIHVCSLSRYQGAPVALDTVRALHGNYNVAGNLNVVGAGSLEADRS